MATLSGNKIKNTYQSLVKFSDNGNITTSAKQLTDGFGNNSPMFVSTTQVGIGVTPESGIELHVYGDAKIGSNLTVIGNLVVEGSTTTVGTDTLTVKDPLIVLANNNTASDAVDIGFYGKYHPSSTTLYSGLFREALTGKYRLFKSLQVEPTTTVNTSGTGYSVASLVANLEGNVTGGTISGTTGNFSGNILMSNNSNPSLRLLDTNNNANAIIYAGESEVVMGSYSTHPLKFVQNTGTALTIDTSKNATFVGNIILAGTVDGRNVSTDGAKLDGIEAGATTDQTAAEIKTAYESNSNTNDFTDADETKLNGIEASADVTDATNVLAAGAVMTTGNQSIAGVKTFSNQVSIPATPSASTDAASKGYVDTKTGENNELSEVLANGNTTGGTDIAVSAGDDITFTDTSKALFGAGNDLEIYHNGTNSVIDNNTNNLLISTASQTIISSNATNNQLTLGHSSGNWFAKATNSNTLIIGSESNGTNNITLDVTNSGSATFAGNVSLPDSKKLILGTGNDLEIYHDGSNSYIKDTSGTGDLIIDTSTFRLRSANGGETMIRSFEDGAVILSHNNTDRLATTSSGVTVTGEIGIGGATIIDTTATYTQIRNPESTRCIFLGDSGDASNYYDNTSHIFRSAGGAANYLTINSSSATFAGNVSLGDNKELIFGAATDYKIYHNSTTNVNHISSLIDRQLSLNANNVFITNQANSENMARFIADAEVKLYYDNVQKFQTTATGIEVSGTSSTFANRVSAGESFNSVKNGADTVADGPFFGLKNAAGTRQYINQLDASNNIDYWYYNGSAWTPTISLLNNGGATFAGLINAPYIELSDYLQFKADDAEIYWSNAANNDYWRWKRDASNNFICDHYNGSSTTAALTLDSDGNVGIGETPFANSLTNAVGVDLKNNVGLIGYANAMYISSNAYYNSGWKYRATNTAALLQVGSTDGTLTFRQAASGTADAAISFEERFKIDSSGNVGIGVSSLQSWARLQVAGTAGAQTGANQALYVSAPSTTAGEGVGIRLSAASGSNEAVGVIGMVNNASGNAGSMTFHTYNGGEDIPERMRISSLGVVSVGTTSPITDPYVSTNQFQQFQVGKSGVMGSYTNSAGEAMFANNIYVGSTYNTFQAIDPTLDGFGVFCYNTSIQFKFADTQSNGTQSVNSKLTIDSASVTVNEGDLFLGATSSKQGTAYFWSNANDSRMSIANTGSAFELKATYLSTAGYKPIDFYTSDSLSMRITSQGELLKGIQTAAGQGTLAAFNSSEMGNGYINLCRDDTATIKQIRFGKNGSEVGSISTTGSTTAFNETSDYRLKEDLQDFAGLDMISKIPVYDFKWKIDESRSYGVMAHELQEVLPDAVTGEKDAEEMQGVDYSKIVPILIKSIQELKAEIELLKQ